MRILLLLALAFSSPALFAVPCSETPKWNSEILPEMKKIQDLDIKGEEDLKAALGNLQKVSKKDNKQMSAYSLELVNKPEFAELQQQRQDLGLKNLSLVTSADCKEIMENNKKLKSAVSLQWLGVLAAVQADTQVYLAKSMGNSPDINATTDTGKKVILHANGTWSEAAKK
jgi:hypothetical protein